MAAVLVHIDVTAEGDRLDASSLAALATGRALASAWGATLYAAVIGPDAARYASELGGADRVVIAEAPSAAPLWATLGSAWSAILARVLPRLVLFGADAPAAGELAPRTAARLGARFLARARTAGRDELELRDRDGGFVRLSDSGATVALVGGRRARIASAAAEVITLSVESPSDPRVELVSTTAAAPATASRAVIVLDEATSNNAGLQPDVMRLAALFDAPVVRAGELPRLAPLAPDLVLALGAPSFDAAGASSVVRLGAAASKTVDASLPAPLAQAIGAVRQSLEDA